MSMQNLIHNSWFRAFCPSLTGTVKRTLKRPTERAQICRRSSKGDKSLSASVAADSQHFARVCSQSRAVRRSVQCTPSYWNGQKCLSSVAWFHVWLWGTARNLALNFSTIPVLEDRPIGGTECLWEISACCGTIGTERRGRGRKSQTLGQWTPEIGCP